MNIYAIELWLKYVYTKPYIPKKTHFNGLNRIYR